MFTPLYPTNCVRLRFSARPGCALCTRSIWIAQELCDEEIYRCVESHEPSLPAHIRVKQGDLVRVMQKNPNGWWDVCSLDKANKEIKSLPATKLEREPQTPVSIPKGLAWQLRRNTSVDDLEHDYYDLTDGVKNKILTCNPIASVPIETQGSPLPYLTPLPNAAPPPPLPPKSDKVFSENELSRTNTVPVSLKIMNFKETHVEAADKLKAKTLSPSPVHSHDKFYLSFASGIKLPFGESSHVKIKKKSTSESVDKPCMLSRISKLTTLSGDNHKQLSRGNSFVSYIGSPEEEKENVFPVKPEAPRLERNNSTGLRKTFTKEEKLAWATLGKQGGFFGSLSKERSDEMLKQNKINGEYLIRSSTSREDSIVLCVYHGASVHRYICTFLNGKFITGQSPMEFSDFSGIVNYYKENPLEITSDKEDILLKQPLLMKRQMK